MRFYKKQLLAGILMCAVLAWIAPTAYANEIPPDTAPIDDPIDSQFFNLTEESITEESEATVDVETEEDVTTEVTPQEFSDEFSLNPYFPDVQKENKYFIVIQFLKHNGLIKGYPDGTFQPDKEINRAEALKVLLEALPIPTETQTEASNPIPTETSPEPTESPKTEPPEQEFSFPDVNEQQWFYEYVNQAFNRGLVKGYPDKHFHPENTINRVEALKIALLHEESEIPETIEEQPFPDVPIDAWFSGYAQVAKERTITLESRSNGNMYPSNLMTRGEFCELIYRIVKNRDNYKYGRASWYGDRFAGRSTASGEIFYPNLLTAAHKTIKLGSYIRVKNVANGNEVVVKVNDRGPYAKGKHLDLSEAAFSMLAPTSRGIINIEYHDVTEYQKLIDIDNGF